MYETPYEVFGMFSYQMSRASRMVIGPGIHAQGLPGSVRRRSFAKVPLSTHEITTEVDRYIVSLGQALSYDMGRMAFVEGAEGAGGKVRYPRVPPCHAVDGSGAAPAGDARVDQFIADGGRVPYRLK